MSPLPDVKVGSEKSLYNIGVVARMTGISMATLRAWERRYEFPESERTAGGHRLYSERDVIRLRWVKERIDEGMQTSQAIHALRHQEQTGHLLLGQESYPLTLDFQGETPVVLVGYHQRLCEVLLRRDLQAADMVLNDALAASSPEKLILHVIGPTLSKIGESWEKGQINIATEHLATNYLRQRLLMWMINGPPPRMVSPIVLACAPNEWHEGSLLILGALLRRQRWPVTYLGQAVPLADLADFIKDLRPVMIVFVAMTESTAIELTAWPKYLPEVNQNGKPIVGYGGRIFTLLPEWRLRIPGIFLGNTFSEGLDLIERLLSGV